MTIPRRSLTQPQRRRGYSTHYLSSDNFSPDGVNFNNQPGRSTNAAHAVHPPHQVPMKREDPESHPGKAAISQEERSAQQIPPCVSVKREHGKRRYPSRARDTLSDITASTTMGACGTDGRADNIRSPETHYDANWTYGSLRNTLCHEILGICACRRSAARMRREPRKII